MLAACSIRFTPSVDGPRIWARAPVAATGVAGASADSLCEGALTEEWIAGAVPEVGVTLALEEPSLDCTRNRPTFAAAESPSPVRTPADLISVTAAFTCTLVSLGTESFGWLDVSG